MAGPSPDITIVIAACEERRNLELLIPEIISVIADLHKEFEIIIVDDGSTDGSFEYIESLQSEDDRVHALRHPQQQGKSAAWNTGFSAARGSIIVTIDGDCEDDPRYIPEFIALVGQGYGCVSGRRSDHLQKNALSRLGNLFIRKAFSSKLTDHGCGLKAFARESLVGLSLERGMHRFIGVILESQGIAVCEVDVIRRERKYGESKYTGGKYLEGLKTLSRLVAKTDGLSRDFFCNILFLLLLFLITVAGLALRCSLLQRDGLWSDELLSLYYSSQPVHRIPAALMNGSVHPPLYFYLLHAWMLVWGNSEPVLRALSVLFGVISVPVTALLARECAGRMAGLFAALLLAFSSYHIHYSLEVRPYSLMFLLLACSFLFFLRLIQGKSGRSLWYVLSTALLLYTHVYGVCAVAAQWACYFFNHRLIVPSVPFGRWMSLQVVIAMSFLPWVPGFVAQARASQRWGWLKTITPERFWGGIEFYSAATRELKILYSFLLLSAICAGFFRKRSPLTGVANLSLLALTPAACGMLVSVLHKPVFLARYLMQSHLFLMVILSRGAASLSVTPVRAFLVGCAVILLSVSSLQEYFNRTRRDDDRGLYTYLSTHASSSAILWDLHLKEEVTRPYYLKAATVRFHTHAMKKCATEKNARCQVSDQLWVVNRKHMPERLREDFARYLERAGFTLIEEKFFGVVGLTEFRKISTGE